MQWTSVDEIVTDSPAPLVSVIVPAMNDGRFIRPCLRSIREQWFPELECVVVDDGSSDETLEIAREFVDKDERFSVVSHEETQGPSAARNTGLAHSSAPLVTFLDADDFLYPHSIRSRFDALRDVDDAAVAGSFCDWQATPQNKGPVVPDREPANRDKIFGFIHGPECPFIVTAPLVRRSVLDQVGGFDEALRTAEDFELWTRILREGFTFTYVPMIGVAYRQKSDGLVFSESADHAEAALEVIDRQYEDLSGGDHAPMLAKPLHEYQRECARTRRLLRTYALATAGNDLVDADRLGQTIPMNLDELARAGLDVEGALQAGVWRASRAIPALRAKEARVELAHQLFNQLRSR